MKKAIIFDLDQTLIDSSTAEAFRSQRDWSKVYSLIPSMAVYEAVHELLEDLNRWGIPIAIVTSSPESYCTRIIRHQGWNIAATVCYHDVSPRKPHPAPILLGLRKLGVSAAEVIAVGDDPKDIQAAKAAHVFAVAATWGIADPHVLAQENPDEICARVADLRNVILTMYNCTG